MTKVMLEKQFGPREILPESMWTGLTRSGEGVKSWTSPMRRAQSGFLSSNAGVWLPNIGDSEVDLKLLQTKIVHGPEGSLLLEGTQRERVITTLSALAITETGCWQTNEESNQASLAELTEIDTGRNILEAPENHMAINQCGNTRCLYHRHYDATLDVPSGRRELLYPNLDLYQNHDDSVITAWGNILPSVDESREKLRELQLQCLPYATRKDALLTLGGISQLSLLPTTGCWFTKSYYMTPVGVSGYERWQYDAYGRLKIPSQKAREANYVDFAILAHRAVWIVLGNKVRDPKKWVLNHTCGFRPCANPDHLEEVSPQANNLHGRMMDISCDMIDGTIPVDDGIARLKKYTRRQKISRQTIDTFWSNNLKSPH